MANDNTPKVTSEPSLDDCELTMDELGEAFEELSNNYDFLKKKYLKMKKENETLQNKIVILSKEKDDLSSTLISTQKDFDAYKISCKAKFSLIDKNEISILKDKINSLGDVLKKCEFDKVRLEAMFPKKHTPKKHVHTTHAHHTTHTHTPKSQHIQTHYTRHTAHTKHAHTPHSHHALNMVEFIHALIVAERVT